MHAELLPCLVHRRVRVHRFGGRDNATKNRKSTAASRDAPSPPLKELAGCGTIDSFSGYCSCDPRSPYASFHSPYTDVSTLPLPTPPRKHFSMILRYEYIIKIILQVEHKLIITVHPVCGVALFICCVQKSKPSRGTCSMVMPVECAPSGYPGCPMNPWAECDLRSIAGVTIMIAAGTIYCL